jgi:hypothetical protein
MPVEIPWHWRVFPLPEFQPVAQGRCFTLVRDGPDPMGSPARYPVIRTGLDHSHDTASGRARRASERAEHALGGDEHGVWTAPDGGAKFVDHRKVLAGSAGGTNDDGERAVGAAAAGSQRAALR